MILIDSTANYRAKLRDSNLITMSNNSDTEGTSHDKPEELPTQPPLPMEATEAPDSSGSGHGGAAQEESKEAG